jgi:hypothetical protein
MFAARKGKPRVDRFAQISGFGTSATSQGRGSTSAFGGKAVVQRTSLTEFDPFRT